MEQRVDYQFSAVEREQLKENIERMYNGLKEVLEHNEPLSLEEQVMLADRLITEGSTLITQGKQMFDKMGIEIIYERESTKGGKLYELINNLFGDLRELLENEPSMERRAQENVYGAMASKLLCYGKNLSYRGRKLLDRVENEKKEIIRKKDKERLLALGAGFKPFFSDRHGGVQYGEEFVEDD